MLLYYCQCHLQVQSRGARDEKRVYRDRESQPSHSSSLQLYGHTHKDTRLSVIVCKVHRKSFKPEKRKIKSLYVVAVILFFHCYKRQR